MLMETQQGCFALQVRIVIFSPALILALGRDNLKLKSTLYDAAEQRLMRRISYPRRQDSFLTTIPADTDTIMTGKHPDFYSLVYVV